MAKEEERRKQSEELYNKFANNLPPREQDDEDLDDSENTLEESEASASDQSDLKATLQRLFPRFADDAVDRVAQAIMVARVHPESYLDQIYLTVLSILRRYDPRQRVDVMGTINMVTSAFSIGLDGKGRIDAIEIHGSAKEESELEKIASQFGT